MSVPISGGRPILFGTFILAFALSELPLPSLLEWWRPEWVAMLVIYWIMALPQRFGVGSAWLMGLMLDVLNGSVLGIHAVALTIVGFITLLFHKRIRMYPLWQQALVVLLLIGLNQSIFYWFQAITGTVADSFHFLIPALMSAFLWPWVFVLLRSVRRTFKIS
ncbi:MAG: rod shape-determining protein MreD [Pseudomonadales bacterium]